MVSHDDVFSSQMELVCVDSGKGLLIVAVKKSGVGEVGGLMKVTEKLQQPHSFEGDCGHRHVLCLRAGQDGGALARQIPTRGP